MSNALSTWLEERCRKVREIEAEARMALHGRNDSMRYRELMRLKAETLAALAGEAGPQLSALAPDRAAAAAARLGRFSASAANSLALNSVFYMSALLYPEDHREGSPNDLERFAAEAAQWE